MLVLSSGLSTGTEGRDLGQLHEAKNPLGAMDQLVRWSRRVGSTDEAAAAVTEAFGSFTGGRPRPVHIEVPVDVLEQSWSGAARTGTKTVAPQADPAAIHRAAEVLAAAEQPMIIAGGGAVDAQTEVTALAEALGAAVCTTVNGKGVVDEAHPLSVGASIRLRALQKAAADSDALLVVGTELGDSDLWEGQIRGRTVIRCDIDPVQLDKNCPADYALLGDAATTLAALREAVRDRQPPACAPERAATLRAACRAEAMADAGPYAEINAAVRAALPADAVLTGDSSLIATATVFSQDIVARLLRRDVEAGSEHDHIRTNRLYVAGFGIVMVLIACALQDVVAALTVAYDILVGGLLVPILGGLVWRRGTNVGAVAAMAVGTVATLATMIYLGDIYANQPIYVGLVSGLVVFVVGSLATKPTDPEVLAEWDRRSSGRETETVPAELT
jgi:hypothetical protein